MLIAFFPLKTRMQLINTNVVNKQMIEISKFESFERNKNMECMWLYNNYFSVPLLRKLNYNEFIVFYIYLQVNFKYNYFKQFLWKNSNLE